MRPAAAPLPLLAVLLLLGGPGAAAEGGAMYRVNQRRSGVFQRSGVAAAPQAAWTAELGGAIRSSPVVWRGGLYIGTPAGIVALDAATGCERWRVPVAAGVDGSACCLDGTVLFITGDHRLLALDAADGSPRWQHQGRKADPPGRGSPLVAYGAVFGAVGRDIVALSLETGKPIYAIDRDPPQEFCSLAGTARELYAMGPINWGYLRAYDWATAQPVWRSNGPFQNGAGVYFFKSPAIDTDGSIYINETRGINKFRPDHQGSAPQGQRGRVWNAFLLAKQVDDNELIPQGSPTPWNGLVFAGRKDGRFVALKTGDGAIAWQQAYPAACLSDPAVAAASGLVVFGCDDGRLRALDAATGAERWSHDAGAPIFASPWLEDGAVYIATTAGRVLALR